jgi:hypothetical protein
MVILLLVLIPSIASAECAIKFDCSSRQATINGKTFAIVCGSQTGRGVSGGSIGHVIRADGKWRPGLVRPGTPMITTSPRLCYDCFIHVSHVGRGAGSNGCLGTSQAGFDAIRACGGSRFVLK